MEGIEVSRPIIIIHASSVTPEKGDLQTPDNKFFLHARYSDGLGEPNSVSAMDEAKAHSLGFCVRTSTAGITTKRTFHYYCLGFVDYLPDHRG